MFNNRSQILTYSSGFVLPHSEKVFSFQEIDKKIEKARKHVEHLTAKLPQRSTHGGKAFRAKKISLQDQISVASDRLALLKKILMETILSNLGVCSLGDLSAFTNALWNERKRICESLSLRFQDI